jgi:predicted DsbA family dithiol-disulfide isomerase
VVCPWCYLGKRRLERALEAFPHRDHVATVHRAFQLDPHRPRHETESRRAMLMTKYRLTPERVAEMDTQMEARAAADGLEFHLSESGVTGNTLDAHQLLLLAADRGRQERGLRGLYRAYFTEGRSVFDRESLVELGGEMGLDPSEVRQVFAEDRYAAAVSADRQEAEGLGVTGVPFFVIDRRFGISGAQPVELFGEALVKAWDASHGAASQAGHEPPRG